MLAGTSCWVPITISKSAGCGEDTGGEGKDEEGKFEDEHLDEV